MEASRTDNKCKQIGGHDGRALVGDDLHVRLAGQRLLARDRLREPWIGEYTVHVLMYDVLRRPTRNTQKRAASSEVGDGEQ